MTTDNSGYNIITIDGPAASGKGTVARRVADALDYAYIDTGAIYRLVAKACLDAGVDLSNEQAVIEQAEELSTRITVQDFQNPDIRSDEVGSAASQIAAMAGVRAALLLIQKNMAHHPPALADGRAAKGAVMDGRDCGTVICPAARYKFFITAKTEVRAERRTKELQSKGVSCTYEAVLQDMRKRDERDSGRKDAPMKPAKDAITIDTSALNSDQVFEAIMNTLDQTG